MSVPTNVCICRVGTCTNNVQFLPRRHLPNINIKFANKQIEALIDSGAQVPLIDNDWCQSLIQTDGDPELRFTNKSVPAVGCNGAKLEIKGSVVGQMYFHPHDAPVLAEFYLLQGSSQQCIFPHPWLKALKVVIDYNTLSLKYELPPTDGYMLAAEGELILSKPTGRLLCLRDDDDDDCGVCDHDQGDSVDGHDGLGDVGEAVGGDPQVVNLSRQLPKTTFTIPPKTSQSYLVNPMNLLGGEILRTGFWQQTDTFTLSVWKRPDKKCMFTFYNDDVCPAKVHLGQLKFDRPCRTAKLLPARINSWTVNMLAVDQLERQSEKLQSSFSTQTKSLENLPLNSTTIPFTIPKNIKGHPFTQETSPIVILHVYLLHLLGCNFKYMLKSKDELKQIILSCGLGVHHRAQLKMESLFKRAKIQEMYSKFSLYIVGLVHCLFLDTQRKQFAIKTNPRQTGRLKGMRDLHKNLLLNMKALTALYFLNQKLINEFFESTLHHPFFQQLSLPASFNQTLSVLGLKDDGNHGDAHQGCDDNEDDGNHGDAHQGCDDNEDDGNHGDAHQGCDDNDDDGNHLGANSIMLHPPTTLPSKSSLSQFIAEVPPVCPPKHLTFRQYCDHLHQTCNSISEEQKIDARKSVFSGKQPNLEKLTPGELKSFVQYSKSPRRLIDFVEQQIPSLTQPVSGLTVAELVETIPPPKWVIYDTEGQILDDYIPTCLRQDFNVFFTYFRDPVFIKYASVFPLPYPPNRYLGQTDPPDPLHSNSGLIDPKTLANAVCQFLSHDHPLVTDAAFYLELLQLACILYSFGQFNVSLHSMDTGWFRRELQVQTLLAPTAPVSSFPSRQATENVSEDLDERLDFLVQQGKAQIIMGSPFLAQITSVPKNYKTGRIIHSSKSDPILKYISGLSDVCKAHLASRSQQLTQKQQDLIQLLDGQESLAAVSDDENCTARGVNSSKLTNPEVTEFGCLIDPALIRLQVFSVESRPSRPRMLNFESSIPPSPEDRAKFAQLLKGAYILKRQNKSKPLRVTFGKVFLLCVNNSEEDVSDRLSFVDYSRFYKNYFISIQEGKKHEQRYNRAAIGTHSRKLCSTAHISVPSPPVQYLAMYSPNIAQLARNKLNLGWAKNQQFLANVNNIHVCVEQMSSHALLNMISSEDPHYQTMLSLAQDPCYLVNTHISNKTNQANCNLVKFCFSVTLDQSKQAQIFEHSKLLGDIQIPRQGSHLFCEFVTSLISGMRRLDHKQPLKASHQERKNVIDLLYELDPCMGAQEKGFDFKSITLHQVVGKFDGWIPFLDRVAGHYQLPGVWIFTEISHSSRYKQDVQISKVVISNKDLYDPSKGEFIIAAVNAGSSEFLRIRPNVDICKRALRGAKEGNWSHILQISELASCLQTQFQSEQAGQISGLAKPRFTKVHYDHIDKFFYQKNAIQRIIH